MHAPWHDSGMVSRGYQLTCTCSQRASACLRTQWSDCFPFFSVWCQGCGVSALGEHVARHQGAGNVCLQVADLSCCCMLSEGRYCPSDNMRDQHLQQAWTLVHGQEPAVCQGHRTDMRCPGPPCCPYSHGDSSDRSWGIIRRLSSCMHICRDHD